MNVVIVGNGIAANEVAFTLRGPGKDIEITIISAEPFPEYDPCSLPYFVGGDVRRTAVFKKGPGDYKNNNINFIPDNPVEAVDPGSKTVTTRKGDRFSYDKLVLAYGVKPLVPAIEGINRAGVFGCKQLHEADGLSGAAGGAAVVIGSGAVGIEAAEALKKRGCDVYIIELLDWMLPAMFDQPAAKRLESVLRNNGIHVLTGEKVLSINGHPEVAEVVTDKRKIPCNIVVKAAGVVHDNAMAEAAGIEVGRGIIVDKKMAANIENIYACGDCAETVDLLEGGRCMYPFKHNAVEQARVVGANILGQDIAYPGAYLFAKIHFFDTYAVTFGKTAKNIADTGDLEIIERNIEREKGGGYLRILLKGGTIAGGQAIGTFADHIGLLMGAMRRGDNIDKLRRDWDKILRAGSLYPWAYHKIGFLLGLSTPAK